MGKVQMELKLLVHKDLSFLRVRATAGGLEISDQVLRLAYFNGKEWQMTAIRLEPGIMEKGKIKDAAALATALQELKAKSPFGGKNKKKKMNVVVSLSSVKMYSQVFMLPTVEGKSLDEAVELNLRMLSPLEAAQAYSGWEVIGKDADGVRTEIAAAFVEKALVDDMTNALYQAGFITVGVESRALALTRILRDKGAGADIQKSYLLLDIDNTGVDFLIIRKGHLYFEYGTEWGELADDKGQISMDRFDEALGGSLRQVMNFYSQHWPEPLSAAILSAAVFETDAERVIGKASNLPVIRLTLEMGQPVSSEWLVALGSSLRGIGGIKDKEINLSGAEAIDMFHNEQLVSFMALWRVVVPVVLACLIIAAALADNFLNDTDAAVQAQTVTLGAQASADATALEASSTAFNNSVSLAATAESHISKDYLVVSELAGIASQNSVTINHISFQGKGTQIAFAGTAASPTGVEAFRDAVQKDAHFGTVNLPLASIQPSASGNGYTFQMTFPLGTGF